MIYHRTHRRSSQSAVRPFVAFLLVASFGILFAGCAGKEPEAIPQADEFTFTAEDLSRVKELVGDGTGAFIPRLELAPEAQEDSVPPVIDLRTIEKFNAMRATSDAAQDLYRVTNTFLNVRDAPQITAPQIGRFEQSDSVEVLEFVDAAWAKVRFEETEGYVSSRYIGKLVSEQQLSEEQKKYEGLYFVDFGFLNVRKEADAESEKMGELPGQTFVRPLSRDDVWARVAFAGGEGYVAVQYLSPFKPNFLVRQSTFTLPVLQYRLAEEGVLNAMPQHLDALKREGYTLWTLKQFEQLLENQEQRDVRLSPKTVIVTIADVTPENLKEVSDILRISGVQATIFLQTKYLGAGIDEREVLTLLANGHDLQSGGHTGDDLRSLTNAQVELELSQSMRMLSNMTKRPVTAIGYPIGGVNDRVARKAGEIGYLLGVTTAPENTFERSQLLRMPSLVIKASTTVENLLSMVSS